MSNADLIQAYQKLGLPLPPNLVAEAAAPPAPSVVEKVVQAIAPPSPMLMIWPIIQNSVTPEDFAWLKAHVANDAPGIVGFVNSDALKTLLQLAISEYRAFIEQK